MIYVVPTLELRDYNRVRSCKNCFNSTPQLYINIDLHNIHTNVTWTDLFHLLMLIITTCRTIKIRFGSVEVQRDIFIVSHKLQSEAKNQIKVI